jgi:hypothetical protein
LVMTIGLAAVAEPKILGTSAKMDQLQTGRNVGTDRWSSMKRPPSAVVAGLGMVAKISAQQFATGGSFKVPGGISGVDSHLVPLALSPG